ncbi:MAG TPA: DUF2239 family protein, partial [Phenylobacterium sp.]
VEAASRDASSPESIRAAEAAAFRVIGALAGNLPNFEEATRALSRRDAARFAGLIAEWPQDVRTYISGYAERLTVPT